MSPHALCGYNVCNQEEWLEDAHGKDKIDYPQFFDAMFTLVDLWTTQVVAEEYEAVNHFLQNLLCSDTYTFSINFFNESLFALGNAQWYSFLVTILLTTYNSLCQTPRSNKTGRSSRTQRATPDIDAQAAPAAAAAAAQVAAGTPDTPRSQSSDLAENAVLADVEGA